MRKALIVEVLHFFASAVFHILLDIFSYEAVTFYWEQPAFTCFCPELCITYHVTTQNYSSVQHWNMALNTCITSKVMIIWSSGMLFCRFSEKRATLRDEFKMMGSLKSRHRVISTKSLKQKAFHWPNYDKQHQIKDLILGDNYLIFRYTFPLILGQRSHPRKKNRFHCKVDTKGLLTKLNASKSKVWKLGLLLCLIVLSLEISTSEPHMAT